MTKKKKETIEQDIIERRGRPIECKSCGHQFKIPSKRKRVLWIKKQKCPKCKALYCTKPTSERILFTLQDEYFKSKKDQKYLHKMYLVLLDYAKSMLKKFYSGYVTYVVCEEDLDYFGKCAVSFLLEEYLKNDDYKVYGSFGGALNDKIKQALFNKYEKLIERPEDLSLDWVFEDNHSDANFNHADKSSQGMQDSIEDEENRIQLLKFLTSFIYKVSDYCSSAYEDLLRLIALDLNFRLGEKFADQIFREQRMDKNGKILQQKTYGRTHKEIYLKTLQGVRQELLKLHQINNDRNK